MKQRLKILYLEDLSTDAELVQRTLTKGAFEFELEWVKNKADFLAALENFDADIILSDHQLPAFDSFGAIQAIKDKGITVPVILITSSTSEEMAVEVIKAGAWDYILKDRMQRLPNAIQSALEKYRYEQERKRYMDQVIENESLLRKTEKLAHIGSFHHDFISGNTIWSDELYVINGFRTGQVAPSMDSFMEQIVEKDREELKAKLEFALQRQHSFIHDYRIRLADDVEKFITCEFYIDRDSNGKPLRMFGFCQDITLRKKTEAYALKLNDEIVQKEKRFRALIEYSNDMIVVTDQDMRTVYLSPSSERITGWSAAESLRMKMSDMIHPGDVDSYKLTLGELLLNPEKPILFITRVLHKKGHYIWVEGTMMNLLHDEAVSGIVYNIRDITERKQAEEELAKSEQGLKRAQEISHIGNFEHDTRSKESYWSDEMFRILGYFPGEIEASLENYFEMVHPEDLVAVKRLINQAVRERKPVTLTHRMIRKDGQLRILNNESRFGIRDGSTIIYGIIHDITEARQQEKNLRMSNERFQLVMNATNEAIIDWDIENDVTEWGNGFETSYGYDLSKYNNNLLSENIHPEDRMNFMRKLSEALNNPEINHFFTDFRLRRADGEIAFIQHKGIILRNSEGKPIRMVGSLMDVTELKKHMLEIEQQNNALKEIAWIQSHVVRAPLARMMGLINLFSYEQDEDEKKVLLEYIVNSATELDHIIIDITRKTERMNIRSEHQP